MITICAWCNRTLDREDGAAVARPSIFVSLKQGVLVSHGICRECAVRICGDEPAGAAGAGTGGQDAKAG
jgi:hypothetical protein